MLLSIWNCRGRPETVGTLSVPRNRRAADGARISISYRQLGPHRPDRTVFHFSGGPGMSNLKQTYPDSLLDEFSVVEVGYRGIDSEPRLSCQAIDRALTPSGFWNAESANALARAVAECFAGWNRAGMDLRGYQLSDVVEDAESVRKALGLGRVHLMADSYGTRVALHYESLYPESIGRSILVGANPPGHFFWSSSDVSAGFDAYQPDFEKAYPQYTGRITLEGLCAEVLERAPRRVWAMRLDPFRVRTTAFILLFHERTSALAFDSFLRAYERSDYRGLVVLSQLYDLVLPRAFDSWADFFVKGLVADFDDARDFASEAAIAPGRFGSPLGEMLFAARYPKDLFAFRDPPVALDIRTPTLILAGALDFSTPAINSRRELVDRFPAHITQVTLPDRGHVADFWGEGDALGSLAAAFLDRGEVPKPSNFSSRTVAFTKRFGPAHVPMVLLAIGFGLVGVIAGVARRLHRGKLRAN